MKTKEIFIHGWPPTKGGASEAGTGGYVIPVRSSDESLGSG